jgi:hypothetical protein
VTDDSFFGGMSTRLKVVFIVSVTMWGTSVFINTYLQTNRDKQLNEVRRLVEEQTVLIKTLKEKP